jgi:hypothetical protein
MRFTGIEDLEGDVRALPLESVGWFVFYPSNREAGTAVTPGVLTVGGFILVHFPTISDSDLNVAFNMVEDLFSALCLESNYSSEGAKILSGSWTQEQEQMEDGVIIFNLEIKFGLSLIC